MRLTTWAEYRLDGRRGIVRMVPGSLWPPHELDRHKCGLLSISCHLLCLEHAAGYKREEGGFLPGEDDPRILCWRNHGNDPDLALRGRTDRFERPSYGIAAYL